MSEKPLLLQSARGVVLATPRMSYVRIILAAIGVLVVLVGAANVVSTIAQSTFGSGAALQAFAPLGTLNTNLQGTPAIVATSTPLVPALVRIPVIGVKAPVQDVGKKSDGSIGAPTTFNAVGWFMLGPKPGAPGNTIIDGHVNNALTTAGVFEHLSQLKPGDLIYVSDSAGHTLTYQVKDLEEYSTDNAPLAQIFATTGPSQIVLITCDGNWVPSEKSFDQRLVVYASLIAQ